MYEFIQKIRWRPEIGDPSTMGWVTVCAYAIAAMMCWLAARRCGRVSGTARGSRELWLLIAALMALLCVNKQLDLQSLLTDIGRVMSWRQGWYEDRREFQKLFIFGLLGGFTILAGVALVVCRAFWKRHVLLAVGLVFLSAFVAVRAVSFHHFDVFLKWSPAGVRMNWLLELSGIALIWLAAVFDYKAPLGIYRKRVIGNSAFRQ
jgi:hypothetical protein